MKIMAAEAAVIGIRIFIAVLSFAVCCFLFAAAIVCIVGICKGIKNAIEREKDG